MRLRKPLELEPNPFLFGESNDLLPGPWQPGPELDGQIGVLIHCIALDGCKTISLPFEDFLRANGSCAGCRAPAGQLLDTEQCDCGGDSRRTSFQLLLIGEPDYDTYYQLAQASDKGARAQRRNATKGRPPAAFYRALGIVQDHACYYCTRPLTTAAVHTDAKAHMEHQDPEEGSILSNLVLSCRRCNTQKGLQDAKSFARTKRQELSEQQRALRSELWEAVRAWRQSREGRAWAAKLTSR